MSDERALQGESAGRVLEGQVALVTGAAQGIGLAIATGLRAAGAQVALVDIQEDALNEAVVSLGGASHDVRAYQADLSLPDIAQSLPGRVAEDFGQLDIVVNNAGRRGVYAFVDYPLADWERTFALNVTAPFLICREAAKIMVEQGGGSLVNVTSVAADLAFGNRAAYNSSKAALVMLTKSIARELGSQGVRCNAVAPGIVETALNSEYLRDSVLTPTIIEGTPMGHWGQPEDIAAPVVFLCSPAAKWITGAVIHADGGWTTGKGY